MPSWIWTLSALAVALAMDATAAAACHGFAARDARVRTGVTLALTFGIFQSAMALGGWALGSLFGRWIDAWDHWIAFALLGALGAKMLYDAHTCEAGERRALSLLSLLALAFATSVDALAAGVTLPALGVPIAVSIVAIGVVTAVLSGAGFAAGRRLGATIGPRLELVGGVVLIALGAKILIENLSA